LVALLSCALFFALGRAVGRDPDPGWMMRFEVTWVNHATDVAVALTWFGYAIVIAPICVALLLVAWRIPAWRSRVIFAIIAVLIAWQGADLFQHLFARPRRLDWVVKHETAFSYPSSHAAVATAFYALCAAFIARSTLRYKALVAGALIVLSAGILWSRLALGAHYVTDLAGGVLWGVTVVAALAAAYPINVFGRLAEHR
jgi:undecaprenyl-diphosphatase